jgi:hypothetical protein
MNKVDVDVSRGKAGENRVSGDPARLARLHHGDSVAATKNDRQSRDMGKRELINFA